MRARKNKFQTRSILLVIADLSANECERVGAGQLQLVLPLTAELFALAKNMLCAFEAGGVWPGPDQIIKGIAARVLNQACGRYVTKYGV